MCSRQSSFVSFNSTFNFYVCFYRLILSLDTKEKGPGNSFKDMQNMQKQNAGNKAPRVGDYESSAKGSSKKDNGKATVVAQQNGLSPTSPNSPPSKRKFNDSKTSASQKNFNNPNAPSSKRPQVPNGMVDDDDSIEVIYQNTSIPRDENTRALLELRTRVSEK